MTSTSNIKLKPKKKIIFFLATIMIIGLIYILLKYNNINLLDTFTGRRNYYDRYQYPFPYPFNFGTRELIPTHLQSYDIRGDVPVSYYPIGVFNQPEYPVRNAAFAYEPNFYTYEYVNPFLGFTPPKFDPKYSLPFNNNNNIRSNT